MHIELTLVLLLIGLVSSQTCPQELDAEVIIIGAGMAGLSAAKRLDELDIKNVLILEGSSKVGGRVTSTEFAGVRVSLGATWIQGIDPASPEVHPLYRLAQECLQGGIRGVYSDYDSSTNNEQGQANEQELRYDDYYNALAAVEELESECVSLRQALNESGWTPTNAADNWVEWFSVDFCAGEAPEDLSILSTLGMTYTAFAAPDSEGVDYFITDPNGYETIIECLANEVVANRQGQLVFNAIVTTIDWSNDDCVCVSANVSGTINQYCSRYAISTVSTGVLQSEESIQFNPELPEQKKEAIQQFGLARYIHIFMEFSEVFWNATEVIGYIANERGYYPAFFNLNLIYPENPKILMGVVTGEEVDRIHSQTETETIAEIEQILSKIYPNSNTTVVDWIIPNWIANPLIRGSFTYLPTGFKSEDFELLAAPVGNLYFSGEATSANFSGFVHGAYFSGIDTAELIASQITSKAMFAQAGFIITVLGMICAIYMH